MAEEAIVLYANGFGSTNVPVQRGHSVGHTIASPPRLRSGVAATVQFAGLVAPWELQYNVVVPSSCPNGDQSIRLHTAEYLCGVESTTAPRISPTKTMAIQMAGFMRRGFPATVYSS